MELLLAQPDIADENDEGDQENQPSELNQPVIISFGEE